MKFLIPSLVDFLLTIAVTPLVIRAAKACNCLDLPGGHRLHMQTTPRWGGLGFSERNACLRGRASCHQVMPNGQYPT